MKAKTTALTCLLCAVCITSAASAKSIEEKVASAAAAEYAKQQIQHQLGEYLNKNPQIVFSSNPKVGSQSMRFISQTLAVYNLVTAKTVRERAWSATYLLASPEPMTAATLFAAQLVDTLLTLKHRRGLARIHERVAEVQLETTKILSRVYKQEFEYQTSLLRKHNGLLDKVEAYRSKLIDSPIYKVLESSPGSQPDPSEEEIYQAILLLADLSLSLYDLDISALYVSTAIDPAAIGLPATFINDCETTNRAYDVLRKQIGDLESSFRYFFASLQASKLRRQIQNDLNPYFAQLRTYKKCVSLINSVSTELFWNAKRPDIEEQEILSECQKRFKLNAGIP